MAEATMTVGGPMFEPANSGVWEAQKCILCRRQKDGAHYNHFTCRDANGMQGLRTMFPDGEANDLNFVLFSTSGVHGTYTTIENAEAAVARGNKDEDGEEWTPHITFLIVHPRICCLRYGNCEPQTAEDFAFLKKLRATSFAAVLTIGQPEASDAVDPQVTDTGKPSTRDKSFSLDGGITPPQEEP